MWRHGLQRIHAGCWVDWDRKGVWYYQTFRPLPPHAFGLLSYFIHHHDQIISNQTLIAVGWPNEIGHESDDLYGQRSP
jgi:DNA-binding response OmpR family regulator